MLRGVGNWMKINLTTAVEYLCVEKVKSSLLSFLKVFFLLFLYNLLKNLMLFSFTVFPLLFVGFVVVVWFGYLKMINDTTRINIIRHKKKKSEEKIWLRRWEEKGKWKHRKKSDKILLKFKYILLMYLQQAQTNTRKNTQL